MREPPFRRVFVGQVVSNVGTWFQTLAQSLLLLQLGGGATELGALTAAQYMPLLLVGGWTGSLLVRFSARRVVLVTALAQGVATALLGVMTLAGYSGIPLLFGISVVLGLALAYERPAAQLLVSELVSEARVANAVSLFTVSTSSARLIGPAVGGLLYGAFGPAVCFLVNAASFGILWAAVRSVKPREATAVVGIDGNGTLRHTLRYLAGNRDLAALVIGNALVGLLAFNFVTTITALASLRLHGSATQVGLAHAATALGSVLGGLLASRSARVPVGYVIRASVVLGVALFAMSLATTLPLLYVLTPVLGLAIALYQARTLGFVQLATTRQHLGQLYSLMTMGSTGTTALGATLCGWLISRYSVAVTFDVGGAACVLTAAALVIVTRWSRPTSPRSAAGRPARSRPESTNGGADGRSLVARRSLRD